MSRFSSLLSAPSYVSLMSGTDAIDKDKMLHIATPVGLAAAALISNLPWWVRVGLGALALYETVDRGYFPTKNTLKITPEREEE